MVPASHSHGLVIAVWGHHSQSLGHTRRKLTVPMTTYNYRIVLCNITETTERKCTMNANSKLANYSLFCQF